MSLGWTKDLEKGRGEEGHWMKEDKEIQDNGRGRGTGGVLKDEEEKGGM